MAKLNPDVDNYLNRLTTWQKEAKKLRRIILGCGLTEQLKWGKPCFMHEDKNIVLIAPFKEHCALLFFKGSLLKDPLGILVKPGENSQSTYQLRLGSVSQITALEPTINEYLLEAVEVEKSGLKVKLKKSTELVYPDEFQLQLDKNPALKTAFAGLTPGRQRLYHMYFTAPKQSKTRASRVEKCLQRILDGKGLNDL